MAAQAVKSLARLPTEVGTVLPRAAHGVTTHHVHHLLLAVGCLLDALGAGIIGHFLLVDGLALMGFRTVLGQEQAASTPVGEGDSMGLQVHAHQQAIRRERQRVLISLRLEGHLTLPAPHAHDGAIAQEVGFQRVTHPHDVGRDKLHPHHPLSHLEMGTGWQQGVALRVSRSRQAEGHAEGDNLAFEMISSHLLV